MPPIKPFMVGCLALMLAVATFASGDAAHVLFGFLVVASYAIFDLLWTFFKHKIWYLPVSSLISGLILSLVAAPGGNIFYAIALALAAVFCKQALRWKNGRHIFNPAAFALGLLYFFTPSISWWAPSLASQNNFALLAMLLVGTLIIWKMNKWGIVLPFLAVYAAGLGMMFIILGNNFSSIPRLLWLQIFDGTLIFFTAVMLIEPVTSAFSTKRNRAIYGALVGAFAVFLSYFTPLDPLIFGLLAGNFASALFRL